MKSRPLEREPAAPANRDGVVESFDLFDALRCWLSNGRRVALATVTQIEGPSPVGPGPVFAVNDQGAMAGSIGGGCLEAAVVAEARIVLATEEARVLRYASGDEVEDIASVCGGALTLELTVVTQYALDILSREQAPRPALYLIGANAYAQALIPLARQLGYEVYVVDPRPAFLAARQFSGAITMLGWPEDVVPTASLGRRDAVVVLAHDERMEVTFLPLVLRSAAGYVGALGSRNANERRLERLRRADLSGTDIARLAAPVGLDLGGYDSAEVAVSIAAEIIALRNAGTGERLLYRAGPIHAQLR